MRKPMILFALIVLVHAVDIRQDTLPNGLLVLSIEAHKLPEIMVRFMIPAGSFSDPVGKEGLANLTNQMLIRGTKNYSGDALADEIESVGGDLSPFCADDYAGLSGRVLTPDFPRLVKLMKECLFYPNFDTLQLARLKREVISDIRAAGDDPEQVGGLAFRQIAFGTGNSYAHDPAGYDSTVSTVTVKDIRDYYQYAYGPPSGPQPAFVVCVGDFIHDSLIVLLTREFGDWPAKRSELSNVFSSPLPERPVGRIIKRDISQAYVFLGYSGPRLRAPDWNATRLMNYILGGSGLTSRIMHSIREEQGLAYDARSSFYRFVYGGLFVASVQTKKEMANQAIQSLIKEIGRIKDDLTADEVSWAKKYYIGHFPLTFDTYGELAELTAQIQIENLGFDYFDRYEKMINGLGIDQIRAAAQKYLHPDSYYLVIVGDIKPEDIKIDGIRWLD